jgi:hypothetical protein
MQSVRIPEYPFQIVSMDVAKTEFQGKKENFLITVGHYSDYFEIDRLSDLTPQSTIVTDNATSCDIFTTLSKREWES